MTGVQTCALPIWLSTGLDRGLQGQQRPRLRLGQALVEAARVDVAGRDGRGAGGGGGDDGQGACGLGGLDHVLAIVEDEQSRHAGQRRGDADHVSGRSR